MNKIIFQILSDSLMKKEVYSLKEIIQLSKEYLEKHDVKSARLESELFLSHILKCDRLKLYLDFDKPVAESERDALREFLKRRASGEPTAYILNKKEFMALEFYVDNRVLIPRPDTEFVVEFAIDKIKNTFANKPQIDIIDIGVGSGAICVSLAHYLQNAKIIGIDKSPDALEVAKINAEKHNVADRILFKEGDLLNNIEWEFDVIISNPPYIKRSEIDNLQTEIKKHEPIIALDGGVDGLDFMSRIISSAAEHINPSGLLFIEIGYDQGQDVLNLFSQTSEYSHFEVMKDLAGNDRLAFGIRKNP